MEEDLTIKIQTIGNNATEQGTIAKNDYYIPIAEIGTGNLFHFTDGILMGNNEMGVCPVRFAEIPMLEGMPSLEDFDNLRIRLLLVTKMDRRNANYCMDRNHPMHTNIWQ